MTAVAPALVDPSPPAPDDGAPLAVVVVSYGDPALLERTLAPAGLPGPDVRVVVVDNWSTEPNRRAITTLAETHGWHLVAMPDNRGFSAGCNAGVAEGRRLGCRTFLFLNPDAVITRSVVAELRAQSLREPLALISPLLVDSVGAVVFRAARTDLREGRMRWRPESAGRQSADPGDWLCAACVVVHDDLLQRIGGFDEGYFLYWEDVDLGYRAVAAGGSVLLRDDLVAVHDEGGTHGHRTTTHSALYYRYNCRNRLLFAARHCTRRQLLRWILATPTASWQILLRGGRRQLLHSPGLVAAAVAGSLSGLAAALRALLAPARRRPAGRHGSGTGSTLVVSPGAELYGSDRVLLATVEALLVRGDVVVALPSAGPLVGELERRGARVVLCRMPVLRKAVLQPAGMLMLLRDAAAGLVPSLRLLRRHAADGVYVNTTILPSWLVLGRLAGRRVVCHVHEAQWPGPALLHRLLLAPLLAATTVVANSAFTAQVLSSLLPALAGRLAVLPNPVPAPPVPSLARASLDGGVRLLFLGRLSPRKGAEVAVDVLGELLERGVEARLTLAGGVFDGYEWFETRLRRTVAERGLAGRVTFLGFRPDVWPVLAEADVVLIPSLLDESFGNAAVEAVLAARPTLVSDLAGLREATDGYAGVRVLPPGRPDRWADAVEGLVAGWDAARTAALADAGRARARHEPERYRRRLAEILGTAQPAAAPAAPAAPAASAAAPRAAGAAR